MKYSFGQGEQEIAEFKPSQQILSHLVKTSLIAGIPASFLAVFLIVQENPHPFNLFTLVLIVATVLLVWGIPAFASVSTWKKILHKSEYIVTNKRVIVYLARGSNGPRSIPLDRISYIRLIPYHSIYSNLVLVTLHGKKTQDKEPADIRVNNTLLEDNVMNTVPGTNKEGKSGRGVRFMRKISSLRGTMMMYLSNEDALRADETINKLLTPQS